MPGAAQGRHITAGVVPFTLMCQGVRLFLSVLLVGRVALQVLAVANTNPHPIAEQCREGLSLSCNGLLPSSPKAEEEDCCVPTCGCLQPPEKVAEGPFRSKD
ncbi:hypothetical protein GWK47_031371 [Chionoecetes opilio]|uniref:Uncharacterized protein n=1 Tax=Chionoecetes opilio TaxID=41210 RepID=A0A8J4YKQ5_CHIOP|nr:hypothetical protein GWK47_031371 [Chionoecetes opilio]